MHVSDVEICMEVEFLIGGIDSCCDPRRFVGRIHSQTSGGYHSDYDGWRPASCEPEFASITYTYPAGHDGQFYYAIAQRPFTPARPEVLDSPARHTRVLFSLVSWIVTLGGEPIRLIYAMPLLNIVAAMGLGWIGAVWAVHQGRPASWGFYLPCGMVPGIAMVLNLTDAVAALTLTCMVLAYLRRIDIWVGPLALLMLLAKEQNALVVVLTGGLALYARRSTAVVGLSFAGVLWCGWLYWIWASFDRSWPFIPTSGNFASRVTGFIGD